MGMGKSQLILSLVLGALCCVSGSANPPTSTPPVPASELGEVESSLLSAAESWEKLAANPAALDADAFQRYQESLCRLLRTALATCRLDPRIGITVNTPAGTRTIPVHYVGMHWFPDEVESLRFATVDPSAYLKRVHSCPGLGVPLLGVSKDARMRGAAQPFLIEGMYFSLTAVLRPNPAAVKAHLRGEPAAEPPAVLELYDPLRIGAVEMAGWSVPMARDLSSPLAQMASENENVKRFRGEFIRPGTIYEGPSLRLPEPYEPGKMPVVFVHGARSDPYAWLNLVNDLRADPDVVSRYQFWVVRYSTGEPFVVSGAKMRSDCQTAQAIFDPDRVDPAMGQWVLIGYSLGCSLVRLQVTYSDNTLWDTFSRKSLDEIHATEEMRERLARNFYFEPLPFVTETIYIGAVNLGPTPLAGVAFRVAALRTQFERERQQDFRRLRWENPFTFLRIPGTLGGIPSSMNLLRRHSPVGQATNRLNNGERISTHNIIGTGGLAGRSDFVVPVHSARVPGADSELLVPVGHSQIHTDERTVERVREILYQHGAGVEAGR
jgi:hypothetical protein